MNQRGVVLVYVLILVAITAYLAAMLLNATLSRRISSQVTTSSSQAQDDLQAAEAMVISCLADTNPTTSAPDPWPNGLTCSGAPTACLSGTLAGTTPARGYSARVCDGVGAGPALAPPCRIVIRVCRPSEDQNPAVAPVCGQPPDC